MWSELRGGIIISNGKIFKLVIAGEKGVGKTAFIQIYHSDKFTADTRITIGVEFYIKDLNVDGKGDARLQIWDVYNEKSFRFLLPRYMKGAHGVMFLFSLTDKSSLSNFDEWLEIFREYDPNIPILLVGTKLDLKESRSVKKEEATELARSRGCFDYIEISSKAGINVELAFEAITKIMWEKKYSK